MQIVRLRADANLDTVTNALRSLSTEKNVNTRFAVVKAKVGEDERAFLVEAHHKKDRDVDLLAAGKDKQITLSTKDAQGDDVRVTGQVYSHTSAGNPTAARWMGVAAAAGAVTAGWLGVVTALGGSMPLNPAPGPLFAAFVGILAAIGGFSAFRHAVIRSDGADWARVTVDSLCEGKPVPVEIRGVEHVPTAVAALPAPTESPFLIPPVTVPVPVREKVTV